MRYLLWLDEAGIRDIAAVGDKNASSGTRSGATAKAAAA